MIYLIYKIASALKRMKAKRIVCVRVRVRKCVAQKAFQSYKIYNLFHFKS